MITKVVSQKQEKQKDLVIEAIINPWLTSSSALVEFAVSPKIQNYVSFF